jgi:mRNA interferase MazF
LQHERFNRTSINTIVVAAITSQTKYAALPGNVLLRKGEAGLPRASVVNVTQISTIDRAYVVEKIGKLAHARISEIWEGLQLGMSPTVAF